MLTTVVYHVLYLTACKLGENFELICFGDGEGSLNDIFKQMYLALRVIFGKRIFEPKYDKVLIASEMSEGLSPLDSSARALKYDIFLRILQ